MGSRSSQQEVREFAANYKQRLFTNLSGVVLEIGPGTGTNLRYFTQPGIGWMGVEPTPYMEPYLEKKAKRLGMQIDLRTGLAHPLPVEDQQCRCGRWNTGIPLFTIHNFRSKSLSAR